MFITRLSSKANANSFLRAFIRAWLQYPLQLVGGMPRYNKFRNTTTKTPESTLLSCTQSCRTK